MKINTLRNKKEHRPPGRRKELSGKRAVIPLWKRLVDLTCIFLALPLLGPIMLVIGAGIKLVSRGPVLFKQQRVGYRGQRFTCLKFRTMECDAGVAVHENYYHHLMRSDLPMTKMDLMGDPRLIPFGSVLRSTGLDELPQILNVLRGEMSLVGPRPCTPFEYDNYLPWHKKRFNACPGLTGLWQVSGKNKTTFTEMINLDIRYAQQQSLTLDFSIMIRTVPTLVSQLKELLEKRKQGGENGEASAPHTVAVNGSKTKTNGSHVPAMANPKTLFNQKEQTTCTILSKSAL
jgi:lipopolysaccharide/colanic/teichoic acid biosynthesis glycosyltransferase